MTSASLIPDPFLSIIVIILVVTVVVLVIRSVNTGKRLQKLTQAFINERHKVSEIVRHLNDDERGMRDGARRTGSGMPNRARDDRDDDAFFAPVGAANGRGDRRPMQEVQHIHQVGPGAQAVQGRSAVRGGAAGAQNGAVRPVGGATGTAGAAAREPYRNAYHEERERRNNKRGFGRRNKPVIPFGADRTNEPRMSRMAATIIDETPALSMDLSEPAQILRQREAEAMRAEGRIERRPMPGDPSMMKDPMPSRMAREGIREVTRDAGRGEMREVREVREVREERGDVRVDARGDQSRFMDGGMQQNAQRRRSQESAYEQTMRQFGGDRRAVEGRRGSVQRRSFNGAGQRQPQSQQRDAGRDSQARQMQGQVQQGQAQRQQVQPQQAQAQRAQQMQAQGQTQPQPREGMRQQQMQPQQREVRVDRDPQAQQMQQGDLRAQQQQQQQPGQQVQREQAQARELREQPGQREQVQVREERRVVEDPRVAQEKAAVSAAWIAEEERRAEERRARAAAEAKRAERQAARQARAQ